MQVKLSEMTFKLARDIVRGMHEINPGEFDTQWDEMHQEEQQEVLKLASNILEKGWTKVDMNMETKNV